MKKINIIIILIIIFSINCYSEDYTFVFEFTDNLDNVITGYKILNFTWYNSSENIIYEDYSIQNIDKHGRIYLDVETDYDFNDGSGKISVLLDDDYYLNKTNLSIVPYSKNADLLDGKDSSDFLTIDGTTQLQSDWNFGNYTINGSGNIQTLGDFLANNSNITGDLYVTGQSYFYDNVKILENLTVNQNIYANWYDWVSGDDWNIFDGHTLTFNESKLATVYYNVTSFNATAGSLTGTLYDINVYNDNSVNVTEVASNPGLDFRINFTNVDEFNQMIFRYKNTAGESHTIILALWDYTDSEWETYGTEGSVSEYTIFSFPVLDSSNHIQDGIVQARVYMNSIGNPNHVHYFDLVWLADGYDIPSGTETDPFFNQFYNNGNINVSSINGTNATFESVRIFKSGDGELSQVTLETDSTIDNKGGAVYWKHTGLEIADAGNWKMSAGKYSGSNYTKFRLHERTDDDLYLDNVWDIYRNDDDNPDNAGVFDLWKKLEVREGIESDELAALSYSNQKIVFGATGFNIYNNYGGSANAVIQTYANTGIGINHIGLGNSFYDTDVQIYGLFKTALNYDYGADYFYFYSPTRRSDYVKSFYGSGSDNSIYFDGTRWIFDSKETGNNRIHVNTDQFVLGNNMLTYGDSGSQFRMDYDVDLNGVASDSTTNRYGFYNNMDILNTADSSTQMGNFMLTTYYSDYDMTATNDALRTWNSVLNLNVPASGDIASATITTSRLNADTDYTGTISDFKWFRALNNGGQTINMVRPTAFYADAFNGTNATGLKLGDVTGEGASAIETGLGKVVFGDTVYLDEINTSIGGLHIVNDSGYASIHIHDYVTHTFNASENPLETFTEDTTLYDAYDLITDKSRPIIINEIFEYCEVGKEEYCYQKENCSYNFDGQYYQLEQCWNKTICEEREKLEVINQDCHYEEEFNNTEYDPLYPERKPSFLGYKEVCTPIYKQVEECKNITRQKITYPFSKEIKGMSGGLLDTNIKSAMTDLNNNMNLYDNVTDFDTSIMAENIYTQSKTIDEFKDYFIDLKDKDKLKDKYSHYAYVDNIGNTGKDGLDMEARIVELEGFANALMTELCNKNKNEYSWCEK